jgi:predicted RNA polymerase sigma factor
MDPDDALILLFMCCHPALTSSLTLRAVGVPRGLTRDEIAKAFLVPEATMVQPISCSKLIIKTSGVPFRLILRRSLLNGCLQFSICSA